jgi:hypothetical protein
MYYNYEYVKKIDLVGLLFDSRGINLSKPFN